MIVQTVAESPHAEPLSQQFKKKPRLRQASVAPAPAALCDSGTEKCEKWLAYFNH